MIIKENGIDGIDAVIIKDLKSQPKLTNNLIARGIGITEEEVASRLSRLEKMNLIKNYRIAYDPNMTEHKVVAFLGLILEFPVNYDRIAQKLREITEMTETYYTAGKYQLLVKFMVKDHENLLQIISHDLQAIQEIKQVETFICLTEKIMKTRVFS